MTNEQAIKRIKHLAFEPTIDEWDEEALNMAIEALYAQPNLQPTCNKLATDTISRQDAIDAAIKADMENHNGILSEKRARVFEEHIAILPSAQPEIIQCKDCKYWEKEGTKGMCNDLYGYGRYWNPDDFCSYAERRTDETD